MLMKLSIIIPVYNVEKYIEKCILSCCNQNIAASEYEIIVVNDGSPDKSLEIALRLEQLHENITIISQSNQGLSAARNRGLNSAKGEYVWFVDSDDWIEKDCILDLYMTCKEFNLDVLLFEANDCDGEVSIRRASPADYKEYPIDGKSYLLTENIIFPVCVKIIKREFLLSYSLFFLNSIIHEDNEFIPRLFYFSKNIMRIDKIAYNVFHNPASITRSINPKKSFDLIKVAQSHVDFVNSKVKEEDLKVVFCNCVGLAINSALANSILMDKTNKQLFYIELKKNKHLFRYMMRSNTKKYRLEARLYLFSPLLFKIFYNVFFKF